VIDQPAGPEGVCLLGVDAGGSSTDFVLTDMGGHVIASASSGGANVTSLGVAGACRVLDEGMRIALARSGSSVASIRAAVLGIAGVDREPQRSGMKRWLAAALPASQTLVATDVELVIAAGTPEGVGLAVVAGTGSVVLARDTAGRTVKVGGRGPLDGDPGSGHAIGLAAMGTGRFHAASDSPRDIAALVPDVAAAADAGDNGAIGILQAAGLDLAAQAADAISRIGWVGTAPCALGGGVVANVARVRAAFLTGARDFDLYLDPVEVVRRPVAGAIQIAMRLTANAETQPGAQSTAVSSVTSTTQQPTRPEAADR